MKDIGACNFFSLRKNPPIQKKTGTCQNHPKIELKFSISLIPQHYSLTLFISA